MKTPKVYSKQCNPLHECRLNIATSLLALQKARTSSATSSEARARPDHSLQISLVEKEKARLEDLVKRQAKKIKQLQRDLDHQKQVSQNLMSSKDKMSDLQTQLSLKENKDHSNSDLINTSLLQLTRRLIQLNDQETALRTLETSLNSLKQRLNKKQQFLVYRQVELSKREEYVKELIQSTVQEGSKKTRSRGGQAQECYEWLVKGGIESSSLHQQKEYRSN